MTSPFDALVSASLKAYEKDFPIQAPKPEPTIDLDSIRSQAMAHYLTAGEHLDQGSYFEALAFYKISIITLTKNVPFNLLEATDHENIMTTFEIAVKVANELDKPFQKRFLNTILKSSSRVDLTNFSKDVKNHLGVASVKRESTEKVPEAKRRM